MRPGTGSSGERPGPHVLGLSLRALGLESTVMSPKMKEIATSRIAEWDMSTSDQLASATTHALLGTEGARLYERHSITPRRSIASRPAMPCSAAKRMNSV